jgi:hypothetical protein
MFGSKYEEDDDMIKGVSKLIQNTNEAFCGNALKALRHNRVNRFRNA